MNILLVFSAIGVPVPSFTAQFMSTIDLLVARTVLLLAVLLVLGCSQQPDRGAETVTLPPEIQAGHDEFQRTAEPFYFALSIDGATYGYTTYPAIGQRKRTAARQKAIHICEKHAGGVPCRIYAGSNGVVWDGPITVEPSALTKTAPPIPDQGPSKPVTLIDCRQPDGFRLSMLRKRCLAVGGTVR